MIWQRQGRQGLRQLLGPTGVSIVEGEFEEIERCGGRKINREEAYMELIFWGSVLYLKDFRFCGCNHDDVNVSLSSIR